MGDGRWEMENGRWEMGDGKWEMGDGKWEMGDANDAQQLPMQMADANGCSTHKPGFILAQTNLFLTSAIGMEKIMVCFPPFNLFHKQ